MNKHNLFGLLILLTAVIGCRPEQNSEEPEIISYAYYPAAVGNVYYYQIDSIDYLKLPVDTTTYFLRERYLQLEEFMGDSFIQIEMATRASDADDWKVVGFERTKLNKFEAERKEGNITFVTLSFPVKPSNKWNGAPYNLVDTHYTARVDFSVFEYGPIDVPYRSQQFETDSSLQVIQYQDSNLIEQRYFIETYAKNVGLVKKLIRKTTKQQVDPADPTSPFEIDEGFKYTKRLYDYKISTK